MKPLLLDLFCGAGGAALGYARAGFEVVGIDIKPQPRYPFSFRRGDALNPSDWLEATNGRDPDAIHASPPCQHYSDLAHRNGNADAWPDLIPTTRGLLVANGAPWVIENVEGSPLIDPIVLCGVPFTGLRVIRHRLFESSVALRSPIHEAHPLVYTRDKRKGHYGQLDEWTAYVSVNGGGNCSVASARDAMGIYWGMTKHELNEAIPPAYTEHVGRQLLAALGAAQEKGEAG